MKEGVKKQVVFLCHVAVYNISCSFLDICCGRIYVIIIIWIESE